ncbi:MAG: alpha/beta hydrolase, partial [Treponema sp.]|nr:alpha/beta hydrolase [Treponema sp.]
MNTRADRRAAVKKLKALVLSPKIEINEYRKGIENEFSCELLPAGVECTEQDAGGVKYDLLTPVV